jgi:hypothetical protein
LARHATQLGLAPLLKKCLERGRPPALSALAPRHRLVYQFPGIVKATADHEVIVGIYFDVMVFDTLPNVLPTFFPAFVTAVMMTTLINEAMSPYSIAVAPLSSVMNRLMNVTMAVLPEPHYHYLFFVSVCLTRTGK